MTTSSYLLQFLLLFVGLFMMVIILLQRGRGGGLAGAFGGMGGQSAFGTKAGDVFTWITVGTAAVWVLLAGIGGCVLRNSSSQFASTLPSESESASLNPGEEGESTDTESSLGDLLDSDTTTPLTPEAGSAIPPAPGGVSTETPPAEAETPAASESETTESTPEAGDASSETPASDASESTEADAESSSTDDAK